MKIAGIIWDLDDTLVCKRASSEQAVLATCVFASSFVDIDERIFHLVHEHFDLRPRALIEMLDLKRPVFRKTAACGRAGRIEDNFTWERTDKAGAL